MELESMKDIDVTKVDPQDLIDIRDVIIKNNLNQSQQIEDFVRQIKNPYCYKYGKYIVKISFENTTVTLTERLRELILKTAQNI